MNTHSFFDTPGLTRIIQDFPRAHVLIIGDIMLDAYLIGEAERISPEAPVPVIRIEHENHLIGGAGNVARNIRALGGKVKLIGTRGKDTTGEELVKCLSHCEIDAFLLPLEDRPTTIKTRILARQQQVIRFDREKNTPLTQRQTEKILEQIDRLLSSCDAIVLSDYGKGMVTEELIKGIQQITQQGGREIPFLVDPKPAHFSMYKGVTLLTPNAKETSESIGMPVSTSQEIIKAGRAIFDYLQCKHLITTLGSKGMAVFEEKSQIWHIPTMAKQVFDVTGAGDTVIATLALGAALGSSLVHSSLLANYAAGIVVGQVGAATVTPTQLMEAITNQPAPAITAWS